MRGSLALCAAVHSELLWQVLKTLPGPWWRRRRGGGEEEEEEGSGGGAVWSRGWSLCWAGQRMCDGRRKEGTRSRSGRCVKHVQLRQNRVQNFRLDHVQTGGGSLECEGVGGGVGVTISCQAHNKHPCVSDRMVRPVAPTPALTLPH